MLKNLICKAFHPTDAGAQYIFIQDRIVRGFWIYGFYNLHNDGFAPYTHILENEDGNYIVIPETMSRYTGITDDTKWEDLTSVQKFAFTNTHISSSNHHTRTDWCGIGVFENDIILAGTPENVMFNGYTVVWNSEQLCWSIQSESDIEMDGTINQYRLRTDYSDLYVVGNRFDVPKSLRHELPRDYNERI